MLIILDGFGLSSQTLYNAIYHADTPNLDRWMRTYPAASLFASGAYVGLVNGYIGNSEVGHMTIGSGRVVLQPVARVHESIADKSFFKNKALLEGLKKIKKCSGRLHIMGILSDAGVHGHIEHLYAFLRAAKEQGIKNVYVHLFLDGRDVAPRTAANYLSKLTDFMVKQEFGVIGSIHGRFYAMDRDKNWDRIEKSYNVLIGKKRGYDDLACPGHTRGCKCWKLILEKSYQEGISDEFIKPLQIDPESSIKDGDGIIFYNFRPDRARQLVSSFVDKEFEHFPVKNIDLSCFVTPIRYSSELPTDFMFKKEPVLNTFTNVLCKNGKSVFAIAETEKYAHVTYFFNGGREAKLNNEKQVLIQSIKTKDYAKHPKMSAEIITSTVLDSLASDPHDFYLINYANADMVGHSGNFEATVRAIECLDVELKKLFDVLVEKMGGTMYVTSDHGNAEQMLDKDSGQPYTAHTTNKVPFIMIKKGLENSGIKIELDQLADIAPFILKQMGLKVPRQMRS